MAETDLDWRGMDRASLDRAYNNAAAVPNSAAILAEWERRSAGVRVRYGQALDLPYGSKPRNCIDFIAAAPGAPTLAFVHGGYWQMRAKETFTFLAEGPLAHGLNVAFIGYTLAPEATIEHMVAEIRSALDWLQANLVRLGGNGERLWLSGWSAGAHLSAMVLDHPALQGCVAISGIYDLEPIRHCYVNDKLRLDAGTAARNSPALRAESSEAPLLLYVGQDELPLMRQQTRDYAVVRALRGCPSPMSELPGEDHFSILDQFSSPEGRIMEDLAKMV